jgi:hypothetical protein
MQQTGLLKIFGNLSLAPYSVPQFENAPHYV